MTNASFPSHLVDPKEKGRDWILQYCKAAWDSFENDTPREIFYHARYRYEVQKAYAMGNQSINKYKPLMGVDEEATETWLNIDWSVIPIVPKFRRIALGKLNKVDFNIVATPIDSLANEETQAYFADTKAKLLIREQAKQINPELLNSPALQLSPQEAKDLEELEMQMNYTFKHQMAIEAEQGIKLIFTQNEMPQLRMQVKEDVFDHGVGGYKEYIDSNGAVKIRKITPRNILINHCKRPDFKDASYIGEIIEMTIADLKQAAGDQFSELEYEKLAKNYIGQLGNPKEWPSSLSVYNKGYDRFRIRILDLEFFSVNQMVYESRIDRRGNKIYARGKFEDRNKRKEKYERVAYKVVYKAKWIIGTDMMFDYGLCTDMKRAKSSLMDTELSYHLFAPEFYDMKAYGMMEQLIPIADSIQINWYKLQNAINQARPKGIIIEMGALEDIPLGAGGKKLAPMEVLDLYNKTGTLVYRKMDAQGRPTNYKPIEELENGLGRDVMNFMSLIQSDIQMIRDITGMNEMTDGSTPDPRTLTTVARMAQESTNNALAHIINADKILLESVAKSVMLRLQDTVQRQPVEGYVRSLGGNTLKFLKVSPKLSMHEFGIMIEDKPTDEAKAQLMGMVQSMSAQGLMDIEDAIIIENTDNLKVAQQLLAYKIKKRKEEEDRKKQQDVQMNAQVQQESAMVAEQAKQQTLQVEGQVKSQLIQVEKELEAKLLEMKYQYELQLEQMRQGGKLASKKLENQGNKSVQRLKNGEIDDEMDVYDEEQMRAQQMQADMMQEQEDEMEDTMEPNEPIEDSPEDEIEDQMEGEEDGEEMEGNEEDTTEE